MLNAERGTVVNLLGGVVRMRQPAHKDACDLYILLHGWTGDEDAMWVFTSRLPSDACWVAPRGFFRATYGGYSWLPENISDWPEILDFRPAATRLFDLVSELGAEMALNQRMYLVGFSLGAAFAMSLCLLYPDRIASLAGLSGFLPEGAREIALPGSLAGKEIFLAHGNQDRIVPIERARQAAEVLKYAGAKVILCEDDVGHKLSASCFRAMGDFFNKKEWG